MAYSLVSRLPKQTDTQTNAHAQRTVPRLRAAAGAVMSAAQDELPFAREIQRSFGSYDVSSIKVARGGAAAPVARMLGASAFTIGERVAFDRSPELRVAAHEAAHVVQQRAGVDLPGGMGAAGDAYERDADAVADAVVRGKDASALLARSAGPEARSSRASVGPQGSPLQCFFVKEQWRATDGGPNRKVDWRISDDLKLAVSQEEGVDGGRHCYAERGLIIQAGRVLARQRGGLGITPSAETLELRDPDNEIVRLNRVHPTNKANHSQGNDPATDETRDKSDPNLPGMSLIDDCGLGANFILQNEGLMTRGVYNSQRRFDLGCQLVPGSAPDRRSSTMLPSTTETRAYNYEVNYARANPKDRFSIRNSPQMMMEEIFEKTSGQPFGVVWKEYLELRRKAKGITKDDSPETAMVKRLDATEAVDFRMGINKFAQPDVGEAYSIVREKSNDKWSPEKRPWPFHWGAVILRSGGDSVTLETFVNSGPRSWTYQMYGPPSKKGQTFHEHHMIQSRGGVPAVGLDPVTIRARVTDGEEFSPGRER